jgi:hypothetical protein
MTTTSTVQGTLSLGAAAPVDAPPGDLGPDGSSLLPEPAPLSISADSMTALAQLLTQADNQDRTAAREREDAADSAAMNDESQRVAQMMGKADQDSSQALATGIGDIAGGALIATAGFVSDGSAASGGAKSSAGTNWRLVAEGAGRAMPGIGTIVGGQFKAEADRDDARAAMLEAQAQMALRRYDAERDEAQAAGDSIGKVQDLLKSLQQTTSDSRSAAASELRG